ncbi:MAG: YgaP family membrane protein [Actinomycetes bacterium]
MSAPVQHAPGPHLAPRSRRRARRPAVNITPAERAGRFALGLAAMAAGAVLLAGAGAVLAFALEALLVAVGLDLVVTGATGRCPLYARLGRPPLHPRGQR